MDIKVDKNTVLVFDLDDTLYNELDYLKSAYKKIAQKLDINNWKKLYAYMLSLYRSDKNVFHYLSNKFLLEKKELIDLYRNHVPDISIDSKVISMLKEIKDKGGYIGIITDGRVVAQTNKIKALGIFDLIDASVISENLGTEKPNKINFETIENQLPGMIYYYIADNLKKDFIAPKVLGWRTVGVIDNGLNIHKNIYKYIYNEDHAPDGFILDLKEIRIVS